MYSELLQDTKPTQEHLLRKFPTPSLHLYWPRLTALTGGHCLWLGDGLL